MGLFEFFKTNEGSKKISGDIKYFDLVDWWLTSFSDLERKRIIEVYRPLGSDRSIIDGDITNSSSNPLAFLGCLAGWFNNKTDRKIAFKILDKAKEYIDTCPILDTHFYYQAVMETYYPEREHMPEAMDFAIEACLNQIEIAPKAAEMFRKEYPKQDLPAHRGYEQLAIIREKQKDYADAIKICDKALKQGWNGNWQDRIERNIKRVSKN